MSEEAHDFDILDLAKDIGMTSAQQAVGVVVDMMIDGENEAHWGVVGMGTVVQVRRCHFDMMGLEDIAVMCYDVVVVGRDVDAGRTNFHSTVGMTPMIEWLELLTAVVPVRKD